LREDRQIPGEEAHEVSGANFAKKIARVLLLLSFARTIVEHREQRYKNRELNQKTKNVQGKFFGASF
jgi:hypothetical protein